MADSKGENDAGSLGRDDLNLYRNRVCRGKLISNLPSFELSKCVFGLFVPDDENAAPRASIEHDSNLRRRI
jgi:hypothetical protein